MFESQHTNIFYIQDNNEYYLKYRNFPVQNIKNIKYNICLLYANNKVNFMFSSFLDGILK